MEGSYKTFYKKSVWLNPPDSPSSASAVFYDGKESDGKEEFESKYMKISDCFHSVRLHKAYYDNNKEYVAKLKLLHDELGKYIRHLENK